MYVLCMFLVWILEQNRNIAKSGIVPAVTLLGIDHRRGLPVITNTALAKSGHPQIEIRGAAALDFALTFLATGLALRAGHAAYVWHARNEVPHA
jgi:hypothetical protein